MTPELEPLITQCPTCGTRFRVSDTQLGRADGQVRCGVRFAAGTSGSGRA
jgi:predicted Zn finger-like uncharacterized protein